MLLPYPSAKVRRAMQHVLPATATRPEVCSSVSSGSRPSNDMPSTLLPEPDSPTRPRISPGRMSRLTRARPGSADCPAGRSPRGFRPRRPSRAARGRGHVRMRRRRTGLLFTRADMTHHSLTPLLRHWRPWRPRCRAPIPLARVWVRPAGRRAAGRQHEPWRPPVPWAEFLEQQQGTWGIRPSVPCSSVRCRSNGRRITVVIGEISTT